MNTFNFDCSQFVATCGDEKPELEKYSSQEECMVDIACVALSNKKKIDYLRNVLGIPPEFYVWEVGNEEFQGEFEEWSDVDRMPVAVRLLVDVVVSLAEKNGAAICVIVQSSTQDLKRIYPCNCGKSDFKSELFSRSLYSAQEGAGAEVAVFWVRNSGNHQ